MTHLPHDHLVERWITVILRNGIIVSAACLATGLIIESIHRGSSAASTLMYGGLILLMFTPFLRVAATVVAFAVERDWKFAAVALFVLLMLAGEIIVAFR